MNPTTNPPVPLERFRSYLLLLARMQIDRAARIEASDVVQQTLMEAHARLDQFSGDADGLAAWLRQALGNNLRDARRAARRQRRDVRREVPLQEAIEVSSVRLGALLAGNAPSPSQQVVRAEELARLADALDQLPDLQRRAVLEHHLQGRSLAETAALLQKTEAAVAGLLHRGLKRLREMLANEA